MMCGDSIQYSLYIWVGFSIFDRLQHLCYALSDALSDDMSDAVNHDMSNDEKISQSTKSNLVDKAASDQDKKDKKDQPKDEYWFGYGLLCRPCAGTFELYKGPKPPVPKRYLTKYAHIKTWSDLQANIHMLNQTIDSPTGCEFYAGKNPFYVDSQGCGVWSMNEDGSVQEKLCQVTVAPSIAEFLGRVDFEAQVFNWNPLFRRKVDNCVTIECHSDELEYVRWYGDIYSDDFAAAVRASFDASKKASEMYSVAWAKARQPWSDKMDEIKDLSDNACMSAWRALLVKQQRVDELFRKYSPSTTEHFHEMYVDECARCVERTGTFLAQVKIVDE